MWPRFQQKKLPEDKKKPFVAMWPRFQQKKLPEDKKKPFVEK
jgi:hypothetical protein